MKLATKSTRTVTIDPTAAFDSEAEAVAFADGQQTDYEAESEGDLCPVCRDLLAWHDQPCEAATAALATAQPEEETPAPHSPTPTSSFAFAIGHRVQPAQSAPAAITWRGQHKERHPATGLVHRINVYYLDNGYWDCYREDELRTA